jgi:tRNA A-37 threonylcarbamoyl transferase component Bud32
VGDAERRSFEKVLFDDQVKLALNAPTRLWASLVWLGVVMLMRWLDDGPVSRALLPLAAGYVCLAFGVWVGRRVTGRPLHLPYVVPFIDIPLIGITGFVWARASPASATWVFGAMTSICLGAIATTPGLLHARALRATGLTSMAVVVGMFAYLRQPWDRLALALLAVAVATAGGGVVVRHAVSFVRRAWEAAEARVKEVEARSREVDALNEELRRQVAERSRELTEALARSEGSVAPVALDVGDLFDGRYRVTRALGRGGMGAVYEVERTRDGKKLALKVVTAALSGKHAARFAREAEIGARLQHENLVSIVDVGIAAGATPFLVMELVQGGSLEEKRARFGDAKWAIPILRQIAAGLEELHANRIVHRDMKPGNVLLVENGTATAPVAKISDFGISRFGAIDEGADVDELGPTTSLPGRHGSASNLTETGAIMGTPVYMPPEAWFGPAKHPSADVFSLGILAYEALTGRSPFAVPPVLLVRSRQPIPTPAPLDGIDAKVASLVLACLRVEPNERPRAKDVAEVLT